nr:microtubule-associated protein futsch isoform X1 [Ipomoea batatas]GMD70859.1 microtubule-associated protein futsch isoform X1 [Ipomoea batatas]GMD90912.1 microtubule-associated protein futsch isoform X1 [Ipomoea batatas]GME10373.1 microtubule-associated protein futsch isoform X1 [Ipomoea batatas]
MENQDHRATVSLGHASHGVHLCHKCGWPFPNPHPSAKHRRAHKKVCGTIEGYKLTESEPTHLAISDDDEHPSDDDRRTPSPKIINKSFKEAAASFKSTRSEDEFFSDAMTDFSDSGHHNPVMDEGGLEAAIKLGKHAQKFPGGDELPKVDAPTDASKPLDDTLKTSQLGDPQLLGSAAKPLDATTPFGSKSKEDSTGLNEQSGQQLDVAPILENVKATGEEVLMSNDRKDICVQENEHANGSEILAEAVEPSRDIAPLQSRLSEPDSVKPAVQEGKEKTSSLSQKEEVESVEADSKISSSSSLTPELFEGPRDTTEHIIQGSKAVESVEADSKMSSSSSLEPELLEETRDAPGHIVLGSKSVEAENKVSSSSSLEPELLEGARDTPGHVILESKSNGEDVKISCPPDQKSDQCQADGNASEVVSLDRKLEPSDELETKMGGKDESGVFLQVSPLQKTDTEDIQGRWQNDFVELCKTEVEEKEDVHLLSEAKDISSLHNAELAVQEYKDYKYLKSNLALDLGAGDEGIGSAQDDVKPDQSLLGPSSILDASGDDTRKDDGKVPIEGKIDLNGSSEVINDENLGSSISVPATLESPILTFEPTNSHSTEDESSQNSFQQCKPLAHSDENSIAPCMGGEVGQIIPTILNASGDDISKDDGKVPIEGKIDPEGSKVIYEEISVSAPTTLENLGPTKDESSQNSFKQCKQPGDSDNNSIAPSTGDEVRKTIARGGSEIFYDCAMDTTKMSVPAENESREGHPQDEYSADTKIGFGRPDSFKFEETQTPVSFGGDDHPDLEKSGTKCLDVERSRSMEETGGKLAKVNGGGAEDDQTSHSLGVGDGSLHDKARTEVPNIAAGSEHRGEDAKDKMANIEPKHDSSVTVLESTNAAGDDERNHENVEHISSISGKHADVGLQEKPYDSESASLPVDLNSGNSATVENNNIVDATSTSGVGSVPLKGGGDDKTTKQQDGVTAVDMSVTSSSRTDSLDANWGSVSVLSIQSETTAPVDGEVPDSGAQEKKTKVERNPDKSDTFEPPSFMTLVESGSEIENAQNAQHPKSDSLKAGWFPSLNNVVNESQGRKKNEEIIAKVTNWSTGKQHTPLKNLLGEAKSPNTKQVPSASATQKDETTTHNTAATATTTTVNKVLSFEPASEPTAPKEAAVEKEWDSPARYPVGIKKEKKKGKAYWVPFVCCSSVH